MDQYQFDGKFNGTWVCRVSKVLLFKSYLGLFGPVWACLGMFGPVWSCLVLFGPVWSCLVLFRPVWDGWKFLYFMTFLYFS